MPPQLDPVALALGAIAAKLDGVAGDRIGVDLWRDGHRTAYRAMSEQGSAVLSGHFEFS